LNDEPRGSGHLATLAFLGCRTATAPGETQSVAVPLTGHRGL